MLTNTTVSKLYMSIIDDVIESMREVYSEEELECRVLDNLRHLWESKMMQSKAMHDPRQDNPSNFVLQLPSSYSQSATNNTASAPVVIPPGHHIRSYTVKNNSTAVTTFSLPAGLNCPVQIPAGVTLQTASGQLYKVNVPVVVTQGPVGQAGQRAPIKVTEWKGPHSAAKGQLVVNMMPSRGEKTSIPISSTPQLSAQTTTFIPQQPQCAVARVSQPEMPPSVQAAVSLEGNEPRPQPLTTGMASSSANNVVDFDVQTGEALVPVSQYMASEIEIPQEVITIDDEDEATAAGNVDSPQTNEQAMLDCMPDLSDIIQLDGPADDSDIEEEGAPLGENDFLRMINAEAINVDESGDGSSLSSSSDDGADELDDFKEEEDPLNSGDDVIEQDIPDLFDTDNVIVCQYDKIHRSKNRWKFHFKDGIMSYAGRDYVFSKAVGEAEW